MSDIKIMSELEISLLQARRAANPDLLVDPVVVDRLMATLLFFRNAAIQYEGALVEAAKPRRQPETRNYLW